MTFGREIREGVMLGLMSGGNAAEVRWRSLEGGGGEGWKRPLDPLGVVGSVSRVGARGSLECEGRGSGRESSGEVVRRRLRGE